MKLLSFGEILFDINGNEACLGGAPLNFAAHLAIQGWDSYIISAVGDDDLGKTAIREIENLGVNTSYIYMRQDRQTGVCNITLDKNSIPTYDLITDTAYDYIEYPHFGESDKKFDVLSFGTLALRADYNIEVLKKIISSVGFTHIYTDLNIRPPFYSKKNILFCLQNATIIKISDEELPVITENVFGKNVNDDEIYSLFANKFPQLKIIIITAGAKGSYAYTCEDKSLCFCEAKKVNAVSTVGAGDSFGAAFLAKYFKGADIESCLKYAAEISAFVVSNEGAIPDGTKDYINGLNTEN